MERVLHKSRAIRENESLEEYRAAHEILLAEYQAARDDLRNAWDARERAREAKANADKWAAKLDGIGASKLADKEIFALIIIDTILGEGAD